MNNKERRLVFWSFLASFPLVFVWAANYYAHPLRILLLTGAVILAAFIIHPRSRRRK